MKKLYIPFLAEAEMRRTLIATSYVTVSMWFKFFGYLSKKKTMTFIYFRRKTI